MGGVPVTDKEPPIIDLHPSEWGKIDRRQPILGVNGKHFLLMFALAFPIGAIVTFIVTGYFPYWVPISYSWSGLGAFWTFALIIVVLVVAGAAEATLTLLRRPRL